MPRYSFNCYNHGRYERNAPFSDIWAECPHCGVPGRRDLAADILTQHTSHNDPWRAYHLSTKKERAAQEQQRPIGGPRDRFEKREMERATGRIYIGDDTSSLRPKSRDAIEKRRGKVE